MDHAANLLRAMAPLEQVLRAATHEAVKGAQPSSGDGASSYFPDPLGDECKALETAANAVRGRAIVADADFRPEDAKKHRARADELDAIRHEIQSQRKGSEMMHVMDDLNEDQNNADSRDALIHFVCTSFAIVAGCATVCFWMLLFNSSVAAFYDAATFTSPL